MTDAEVRQALREVVDPEPGLNIVDLGLVYTVDVQGDRVYVAMTMTTPGCPVTWYLVREAEEAIWRLWPQAKSVHIDLVWDPPWDPSRMSDEARRPLGWETPEAAVTRALPPAGECS